MQRHEAQRHRRQREVVVGGRRLERRRGQTSSRPSSPPVRVFHLKITVKTICAKASESIAKYVWVRRTMKKPKTRAPAAAANGAAASPSSMGHPACLTRMAAA